MKRFVKVSITIIIILAIILIGIITMILVKGKKSGGDDNNPELGNEVEEIAEDDDYAWVKEKYEEFNNAPMRQRIETTEEEFQDGTKEEIISSYSYNANENFIVKTSNLDEVTNYYQKESEEKYYRYTSMIQEDSSERVDKAIIRPTHYEALVMQIRFKPEGVVSYSYVGEEEKGGVKLLKFEFVRQKEKSIYESLREGASGVTDEQIATVDGLNELLEQCKTNEEIFYVWFDKETKALVREEFDNSKADMASTQLSVLGGFDFPVKTKSVYIYEYCILENMDKYEIPQPNFRWENMDGNAITVRENLTDEGNYRILYLQGVSDQETVEWFWTSEHVQDSTEVNNISWFQNNELLYIVNKTKIIVLNVKTGQYLWGMSDNLTSGSVHYVFDENGVLYLCDYYGPDIIAIDTKGNILWKIDDLSDQYNNPCDIAIRDGLIMITYQNNGNVLYVNTAGEYVEVSQPEETVVGDPPEKLIGLSGEWINPEPGAQVNASNSSVSIMTIEQYDDSCFVFSFHTEYLHGITVRVREDDGIAYLNSDGVYVFDGSADSSRVMNGIYEFEVVGESLIVRDISGNSHVNNIDEIYVRNN